MGEVFNHGPHGPHGRGAGQVGSFPPPVATGCRTPARRISHSFLESEVHRGVYSQLLGAKRPVSGSRCTDGCTFCAFRRPEGARLRRPFGTASPCDARLLRAIALRPLSGPLFAQDLALHPLIPTSDFRFIPTGCRLGHDLFRSHPHTPVPLLVHAPWAPITFPCGPKVPWLTKKVFRCVVGMVCMDGGGLLPPKNRGWTKPLRGLEFGL